MSSPPSAPLKTTDVDNDRDAEPEVDWEDVKVPAESAPQEAQPTRKEALPRPQTGAQAEPSVQRTGVRWRRLLLVSAVFVLLYVLFALKASPKKSQVVHAHRCVLRWPSFFLFLFLHCHCLAVLKFQVLEGVQVPPRSEPDHHRRHQKDERTHLRGAYSTLRLKNQAIKHRASRSVGWTRRTGRISR